MTTTVLIITSYLAAINLLAILVFGYDKGASVDGRRRISERALLNCAIAGGSLGACLASRVFRHKTRKRRFRRSLYAIAVFHLILLAGVWGLQMIGP